MDTFTESSLKALEELKQRVIHSGDQQQREKICEDSPYTGAINKFISNYEELRLYHNLKLSEAIVTRRALIKDIDLDLWVSSAKCTNRDLMKNGNAPYAYDAEDGKIEIHHIGQNESSPFAELTFKEHMMYGASKTIHSSGKESWRNNSAEENKFYMERSKYWKKRASGKYTVITEVKDEELPERNFELPQELQSEIKDTIEILLNECSVSDLEFLSDLAKSYALVKRTGVSSMNDFLFSIRGKNKEEIRCAYCKSANHILYGCYSTMGERFQRYKCKDCGKVFSPISNSLISSSNFNFKTWIKFIDCVYNGQTLNQIAKTCGISEQAAHDNRIRLFYALKLLDDKVKLSGNIVIDETYIPVSYKGNRTQNNNFVLPREAHHRGHENHLDGLSKNLVCVVCALDENGKSVAHVAGTGNSSVARLDRALRNCIIKDDELLIYSDCSNVIKRFAEVNGYPIKQTKLLNKNRKLATNLKIRKDAYIANRYLQKINAYHSRLKHFFNKFFGMSTKLLSGYLYLFAWKERNKDKDPIEAYKELLAVMTKPDTFVTVDAIISHNFLPDALEPCEHPSCFKPSERDMKIYARNAAGETMTSLAKEYGMTKQNVSRIIKHINECGYGYKTEKDIPRKTRIPKPINRYSIQEIDIMLRDYQIYTARLNWTGSLKEYFETVCKLYHLSKSSVRTIIGEQIRLEHLREDFRICDDISYISPEKVYKDMYSQYKSLREENPEITRAKCCQIISENTGYTQKTVNKLIRGVSNNPYESDSTRKRRCTKENLYNRDKSVFIDFIKWEGDRKSFCVWAQKKYNLSEGYIRQILRYSFCSKLDRIENLQFRPLEE